MNIKSCVARLALFFFLFLSSRLAWSQEEGVVDKPIPMKSLVQLLVSTTGSSVKPVVDRIGIPLRIRDTSDWSIYEYSLRSKPLYAVTFIRDPNDTGLFSLPTSLNIYISKRAFLNINKNIVFGFGFTHVGNIQLETFMDSLEQPKKVDWVDYLDKTQGKYGFLIRSQIKDNLYMESNTSGNVFPTKEEKSLDMETNTLSSKWVKNDLFDPLHTDVLSISFQLLSFNFSGIVHNTYLNTPDRLDPVFFNQEPKFDKFLFEHRVSPFHARRPALCSLNLKGFSTEDAEFAFRQISADQVFFEIKAHAKNLKDPTGRNSIADFSIIGSAVIADITTDIVIQGNKTSLFVKFANPAKLFLIDSNNDLLSAERVGVINVSYVKLNYVFPAWASEDATITNDLVKKYTVGK